VINRTNSLTGVKYKEDPAIMAWELANEPRCESDKTGNTLLAWTTEMSRHVKTLAPKQLVSLGDEGFFARKDDSNWAYNGTSGVDFERNLAVETIDFGTYHLYPDDWGESWSQDPEAMGLKWIEDHIAAGAKARKPVILEEYGLKKTSKANRDLAYEAWNNTVYEKGGAAAMFWILTGIDTSKDAEKGTGLYPDYDGFRVVNNGSRTAELLKRYAKLMSGQGTERTAAVYIAAPKPEQPQSKKVEIAAKVFGFGKKVKSVTATTASGKTFTLAQQGDKYVGEWDTTAEKYGAQAVSVAAKFEDGTSSVDKIDLTIDNRPKKLEKAFTLTFDKDIKEWQEEGTWQAELKKPTPTFSRDLGQGAMKVNVKLPGKADWEEIKIKSPKIKDMDQFVGMEYETYLPAAGLKSCRMRPYVALNPNWMKVGLDANNTDVTTLAKKKIGGKDYYVHTVRINFGRITDKNEFILGIVGDMCAYEGPLYIDNITFFKEVPIATGT
jgi:mannan endo-1,4-beta-mannosidase